MNYIKEINAFYDHMERNPLSASAVTLWHTLMHINNKARWVETFTVAAPVIRMKSGLKDSSFKRARMELKEKGYIDYQSRSRNQAPMYRMVRLSGEEEAGAAGGGYALERQGQGHVRVFASEEEARDRRADEGADHLAGQGASALIKHKENNKKQNNRGADDSVVSFFRENFGVVSPYVSRELLYWANNMGEQLVMYAMKRALDRGKTNWGYVRAILENWEKKGIRSVRDVQEEGVRFRRERLARKGRGSFGVGRGKEEVVPEWFWERRKQRKDSKVQNNSVDREKKVEEIERRLKDLS